jgi:hypothetical protein
MCEFLDYRVSKLKRVRIMNIKLDLPVGQWRYLNEDEILVIQSMVADSIKAFDRMRGYRNPNGINVEYPVFYKRIYRRCTKR